ncbi:lactose permease [Thozetella sp. PMI_491]|nr:lactose permease [Thozetella sp. PMI_491]
MTVMEKETHAVYQIEQSALGPDPTMGGIGALQAAAKVEPVRVFRGSMVKLWGICLCMFLETTMTGYDASLMGTLIALPSFQTQFGASIVGVQTGLISSMYAIGGVCAVPFSGPFADSRGRRAGIIIGALVITLGTILQGRSEELSQYLAGRFFIGYGAGIASGGASSYVAEIAHPVYRGVMAGLFNCLYYAGSFLAAILLRGCVQYSDHRSWLIPTWFQIVPPAVLLVTCPFFPESPRWLYTHGKLEECLQLQMRDFEKELELQGADKRWWDYRCLFKSRSSLYRVILCAVAVPAFSQWTGQAAVSYFLPAVPQTMGITSTTKIMDINIGIAVASGVAACFGASQLDGFGRRKLLIGCCIGLVLSWVAMVDNADAARGSIAFMFMVTVVFSIAYTPLQKLYPVECLMYEQRAKGIAFASMMTSATALVNLFATPIAMKYIGWKTYGIWIGTCTLQAIYYYFFMVETKGRTLEETNIVFAQKNPRKASYVPPGNVSGMEVQEKEA